MKVVGMIPARSGSKGLPDKNILPLAGKPLMAYTIEAAIESAACDAVVVNSDSVEYLRIASDFGAETFLRSEVNATDSASMRDVLSEFVAQYHGTCSDCAVVVLYPTYPMRHEVEIFDIVQAFKKDTAACLIGLQKPKTHPFMCCQQDHRGLSFYNPDFTRFFRRQDYPTCHELTHCCCVVPVSLVSEVNAQLLHQSRQRYKFMSPSVTLDIDTEDDFAYAEFIFHQEEMRREKASQVVAEIFGERA